MKRARFQRGLIGSILVGILAVAMSGLFSAYAEDIRGEWVRLRLLDKIAALPQTIDVRVGDTIEVDAMRIVARACFKKPPEEFPETSVWLEVHDKSNEDALVFRGWMFASSPALSSLAHPVYDLWVVDCFERAPS
ncbi:MAG: DUF2155 domain-containing protein [Alphaproteobacteria bacterium GM202ARS2]|nr:DUF2155 domain-containing protein [Alphaproteobacteria bacterium GM202ARS2]